MRAVGDEQTPRLNQGEKGWNDDEPAVVEAACQLATRQYFSLPDHMPLESYASFLHFRLTARMNDPPPAADIEAILRAALDETVVFPAHFRRGFLFAMRGAITCYILINSLQLDEKAIDQLLLEAESTAIAGGFHPPIANPPGSCA